MAATNPLSRGYAQIMAALEGWPALTAIVRPGNFQDAQSPKFGRKANPTAGDRVEIKVLEKRLRAQPLSRNSLGVFFDAVYPIAIASGQMGVDKANLVSALVLQALTHAGPRLGLGPMDIIQGWQFVDGTMIPRDDATGRPDWTITCGVLVSFAMSRADFLAATFT